jgi:hypothetical protein
VFSPNLRWILFYKYKQKQLNALKKISACWGHTRAFSFQKNIYKIKNKHGMAMAL